MIALNQVRADLTLAAAWCEILHPRVAGSARLRPCLRTALRPDAGDAGGAGLAKAERINALAGVCREILRYAPLDFGAQPDRIRAALIRIEARSNHDRAAALRHFSGLSLTA